jgi:hypothetical protein
MGLIPGSVEFADRRLPTGPMPLLILLIIGSRSQVPKSEAPGPPSSVGMLTFHPRHPGHPPPEARAGCGKSARPDPCGGYGEIRIPTATP